MKVYYTDRFVLPLPDRHRFPMAKYSRLRQRVERSSFRVDIELIEPDRAGVGQLTRVHDPDYVTRVLEGRLTREEVRRIGFPWSPALVERALRSVGATVAASRTALEESLSINLAGGTHHAFRGHGEGFCVLNDAAVAAAELLTLGLADKVAIIDCDVHQGNGTASIFRDESRVYTFSIHGRNNFPFRKERSDLDVALPDGAGDSEYLDALRRGLDVVTEEVRPDVVIYLAGADPFAGDKLGRLDLTKAGLAARDRLVLMRCTERGMPAAIVMSGGYAPEIEDIVDIHYATVLEAADLMARVTA